MLSGEQRLRLGKGGIFLELLASSGVTMSSGKPSSSDASAGAGAGACPGRNENDGTYQQQHHHYNYEWAPVPADDKCTPNDERREAVVRISLSKITWLVVAAHGMIRRRGSHQRALSEPEIGWPEHAICAPCKRHGLPAEGRVWLGSTPGGDRLVAEWWRALGVSPEVHCINASCARQAPGVPPASPFYWLRHTAAGCRCKGRARKYQSHKAQHLLQPIGRAVCSY